MSAFALLACVVLAQPAQPPQSLLHRLIPSPTRANGYEEFLAAADVVSNAEVKLAADRALEPNATLEHARKLSRLAKPAFDLVRRGLQKPVVDPRAGRELSVDTLFPELPAFRTLTRAYAKEMYVQFADGSPRVAVQRGLEGLSFAQRVDGFTVIQLLVASAMQAVILAEFDRNLAHVPEVETQSIIGHVADALDRGARWPVAMATEMEFFRNSVRSFGAGKLELGSLLVGDQDPVEWIAELDKLDARGKANVARNVEAVLGDRLGWIEALGRSPESDWFVSPQDFKTGDPVADQLADLFVVNTSMLAVSDARIRTQLRLLRLHAAVTQFRWRNLRLPSSLDELGHPEWVADPLSQKPFAYRRTGSGGYELYSEGARQTGRIDLRYVRLSPDSTATGEP